MTRARDIADRNVDSTTIDGVDSTQLLRSDVADTKTAGDLTFSDNVKAIFGGELQIYSDATHARIVENGTGQLKIQGNNMQLLTSDGASTYLEGNASTSAVTLYHASNSPRLTTTSGGIDVTGTVTADGLTVDNGSSGQSKITISEGGANTRNLVLYSPAVSGVNAKIAIENTTANLDFVVNNGAQTAMQIAGATGDISFYDSTGVTQGFYWDASEVRLGLGTTSPARNLHLYAENSDASVRLQNTANSKVWEINPSIPGVANSGISVVNVTDNTVPLHIDNSGNVGIKNSTPSVLGHTSADNLVVGTTGGDNGITIVSGTSGTGRIAFADSGDTLIGRITYDHNGNYMSFGTAGAAEHLRIDSSGNVGIGTTGPINKLHIRNTTHSSTITGNANAGSIKFHSQSGSYTNGDYYGGIVWARPNSNGGTPTTFIASKITNSGSAADLVFGADTATTVTERMRIDNAGRVLKPYQPSCYVYGTNTQTISSGDNYHLCQMGTEVHDIGNNFNTTTHRFTAPVDGVYIVYYRAMVYFVPNTRVGIALRKNGTNLATDPFETAAGSFDYPRFGATKIIELSANDYLTVHVNQYSGSNQTLTNKELHVALLG